MLTESARRIKTLCGLGGLRRFRRSRRPPGSGM